MKAAGGAAHGALGRLTGRQLIFPPTISCDSKCNDRGEKWCQRCYMSPVHCTLPFSVPCAATVDEHCAGNIRDCIHYPEMKPSAPEEPAPSSPASSTKPVPTPEVTPEVTSEAPPDVTPGAAF
jgi:hypothetical protein